MLVDRTVGQAKVRPEGATKFLPLFDILSIVLIALPALAITIANLHNAYDDAYITYRYSYNFATGNGFVYNVGERFLGTTAPFYGLLLGVLGLVQPEAIPTISSALSGLALGLTGIALYLYGRHYRQPFCGLLAGLFYVLNPMLPSTIGGELLFQTALIAWGFLTYATGRTVVAAVLLALAVLTRPDGIVAAGIIGLHYLVTRRRLPWREILTMGLVIVPFALLAWFYFGSALPGTLGAKQAQIESGIWPLFVPGMVEWIRAWTMQGTSQIFPTVPASPNAIRFVLFVLLGVPAIIRYRFWILPLSWAGLYALAYHILGVPFYHWYVIPVVFGLMIVAGSGVAAVVELTGFALRRVLPRVQPGIVTGLLNIGCLVVLLPGLYAQLAFSNRLAAEQPDPAERLYTKTGQWLAANTPPDATIGYFEIGYLGYHAQRHLLDPLGLVNEGVAAHIANREWTWAYEHYRPDYIIHNQLIFTDYIGRVREEPWFQQEYREVTQITQDGYPALIIYRRQP